MCADIITALVSQPIDGVLLEKAGTRQINVRWTQRVGGEGVEST